ncbi:MAG TPA: glycosyltransferase family 4 protein [Candidatus Saccharibacteria bacterium]|jgi:phosphatidylinositol alpha-mannosyltransferase|nr:glycosyltransferase family 4 protein [Candidatus Saccharibacteria bacterium]HMT55358.1 glycosyltransferase family 4 protein [Candidatus Saccharibacteria bacterium]
MKIAYVLDDTLDKSDGVQQAVLTIADEMKKRGHDVHFIVPETKRTDLENIHIISRYISMRFNGNTVRTPLPASKKAIKLLLAQEKFDVLHVQMPYSPLLAGRIVHLASKTTRVVGTFHILPYNTVARIGTKALGWFLRKNARRFDVVYAVSKPAHDFMVQTFGVSGKVLGNPVNYRYFHSYSEAECVKGRIVFVGRFDERKGVRQLVEAYEKLDMAGTELIMCGKGPQFEAVKMYAETRHLNVVFKGFVSEEEKAQLLASAQVAVFPSVAGESFGIVLIEAMSAGSRVTIAGNNPGYASVMYEWPETLFDPNNINKFAEKLHDALTNDRYSELGLQQREIVKQFDVTTIVEELIQQAYIRP